jgi:thiol-disulfide isomerase/thioredoxin
MQLTMYGREECCLCDEMWAVVEPMAREHGVPVEKIDVDSDPALARAYGERVPLLCIDGRPAFKYRVTGDALRTRLAGASR